MNSFVRIEANKFQFWKILLRYQFIAQAMYSIIACSEYWFSNLLLLFPSFQYVCVCVCVSTRAKGIEHVLCGTQESHSFFMSFMH